VQGIKNKEGLEVVDEGSGGAGLLQFYYILTPLFLIAELICGVNTIYSLTATLSNSAASKKQTRAFWRGSRNYQLRLLSIAWVFSRLGKNKKEKGKIVESR
jgi:hypothetical protein